MRSFFGPITELRGEFAVEDEPEHQETIERSKQKGSEPDAAAVAGFAIEGGRQIVFRNFLGRRGLNAGISRRGGTAARIRLLWRGRGGCRLGGRNGCARSDREEDDEEKDQDKMAREPGHGDSSLRRRTLRGGSISELNRAVDTELAHARLERGALHSQKHSSAFGAGDAPLRLFQGAEDVLTFGFFECGNWGG